MFRKFKPKVHANSQTTSLTSQTSQSLVNSDTHLNANTPNALISPLNSQIYANENVNNDVANDFAPKVANASRHHTRQPSATFEAPQDFDHLYDSRPFAQPDFAAPYLSELPSENLISKLIDSNYTADAGVSVFDTIEKSERDANSSDQRQNYNSMPSDVLRCKGDVQGSQFIELARVKPLATLSAPSEHVNSDNLSNISKNSAVTKSSRVNKVTIMKPEVIEEDVNLFDLPLKELILKIPKGESLTQKANIKAEKEKIKRELAAPSANINYIENESIKDENEVAPDLVEQPEPEESAPALCLDADGNLIVDRATLFVKAKSDYSLDANVTNEDDFDFKDVRRRGTANHKWSKAEVKKFYLLLRMIGSNFTTISRYMGSKTQRQCLKKYKSECKTNQDLVNSSLKSKIPFNKELVDSIDKAYDTKKAKIDTRKVSKSSAIRKI